MIVSIGPEKAFAKIQHPFVIKFLQTVDIQGTYLNVYKKRTANVILWIIEKAREVQKKKKKIYFCFIDYSKSFDCVDHKNGKRDGNTRPSYLPSEKPVCRLRSNS